MTPTERKKLIATINARVAQLLAPYGITVTYAESTGRDLAEFTFRIPGVGSDPLKPSKHTEIIRHLDLWELQQYHTSAECLDKLPHNWAAVVADYAPELFETAPLPTAAEVDWRPIEMIPEDFGAA